MAKTPSNMVSLGTKAVKFNLPDVTTDSNKSLDELKGDRGTVIMFICNHCPYVKHVNTTVVEIAKKYQQNGIKFIAISSTWAPTSGSGLGTLLGPFLVPLLGPGRHFLKEILSKFGI